VLAKVADRSDLPEPSYILHSSPNRVHIFWHVNGFEPEQVEAQQKRLARELGTDIAATPASQTTRMVGFKNHKYSPAHVVTIEYRSIDHVYTPADFPIVEPIVPPKTAARALDRRAEWLQPNERARRYLARVLPAIAGQHSSDSRRPRYCSLLITQCHHRIDSSGTPRGDVARR
jgi:hypothetical protein